MQILLYEALYFTYMGLLNVHIRNPLSASTNGKQNKKYLLLINRYCTCINPLFVPKHAYLYCKEIQQRKKKKIKVALHLICKLWINVIISIIVNNQHSLQYHKKWYPVSRAALSWYYFGVQWHVNITIIQYHHIYQNTIVIPSITDTITVPQYCQSTFDINQSWYNNNWPWLFWTC